MNAKGFVLSFSALLIFITILLFATYYSELNQRTETMISENLALEKAGYVVDDIITDFNRTLGTQIDGNRTNNFTDLWFFDKIPSDTNKEQIIDLNNFITSTYAKRQATKIKLNFQNLIDGKTELIFSNKLQYDYNYDANIVDFYLPNGNTEVVTYKINIKINDSSIGSTPWSWDSGGDINVTLNFSDDAGTNNVSQTGKLNSSIENIYKWDYNTATGEAFYLKIGNINGNQRALQINEKITNEDSFAMIGINAKLNSIEKEIKWFYDADLNYSQNDLNINRKIVLGST